MNPKLFLTKAALTLLLKAAGLVVIGLFFHKIQSKPQSF